MTRTILRRASLLLLACAATPFGCRDGLAPFAIDDADDVPGDTYQLTFSVQRDFNPTWSTDSDSVYYSTDRFVDYPSIGTTLIRIARSGGAADLLAPGAQTGTRQRLVLPVPSPTGDRVAFVHIPFVPQAAACIINPPADPVECVATQPLLESGFVRVRTVTSTASAGFDAGVPLVFEGFDYGTDVNGVITAFQELFPFQQAYTQRGEFLLRPSWSPDGQRLVFSDGLRLRLWDVSQTTAPPLANTDDGVSAAWSPAGDAIAFARLIRADSVQITCRCIDPGTAPEPDVIPIHNRWLYTVSRSVITLIAPDGSNPVEVVDGVDPAWSPDGGTIYYVADNQVYRIPRTGGTPVAIPGTVDGRWPSVSPDGQWLAFVRTSPGFTDSNIWITRVSAQ